MGRHRIIQTKVFYTRLNFQETGKFKQITPIDPPTRKRVDPFSLEIFASTRYILNPQIFWWAFLLLFKFLITVFANFTINFGNSFNDAKVSKMVKMFNHFLPSTDDWRLNKNYCYMLHNSRVYFCDIKSSTEYVHWFWLDRIPSYITVHDSCEILTLSTPNTS